MVMAVLILSTPNKKPGLFQSFQKYFKFKITGLLNLKQISELAKGMFLVQNTSGLVEKTHHEFRTNILHIHSCFPYHLLLSISTLPQNCHSEFA